MTDLRKLKRVFDSCREYRGHTIEQAAKSMEKPRKQDEEEIDDTNKGYSDTTINRFFKDDLKYPDNVEYAVRGYIYETQLVKAISELGLNPDDTKSKLAKTKG